MRYSMICGPVWPTTLPRKKCSSSKPGANTCRPAGRNAAKTRYPESPSWIFACTGMVAELIGYDYEAMGLERLYQASDMLWPHREAL